MNYVLEIVWTWPFIIGMVVGIVGQRLYCRLRARWEDRHHPNADGSHHPIGGIDRRWLGGLIAVGALLYVLMQGQQTHDDTVALSKRTAHCQEVLIQAIKDRGALSDRRDDLSEEQRRLLGEVGDDLSAWIAILIAPPPNIAALDPNDPVRQQWGIDVTKSFYDKVAPKRARIAEITRQASMLEEERARQPLPDPRCGQ